MCYDEHSGGAQMHDMVWLAYHQAQIARPPYLAYCKPFSHFGMASLLQVAAVHQTCDSAVLCNSTPTPTPTPLPPLLPLNSELVLLVTQMWWWVGFR